MILIDRGTKKDDEHYASNDQAKNSTIIVVLFFFQVILEGCLLRQSDESVDFGLSGIGLVLAEDVGIGDLGEGHVTDKVTLNHLLNVEPLIGLVDVEVGPVKGLLGLNDVGGTVGKCKSATLIGHLIVGFHTQSDEVAGDRGDLAVEAKEL
jgi:hypothetical protein